MSTDQSPDLAARLETAEAALDALRHQEADAILGDGGVSYVRSRELVDRQQRDAQALREREAHFRATVDTAPILIWTAGPDMGCTWVNQRWLLFTGRSLDQELGHGWVEALHPDDAPHALACVRDSYERRTEFELECRVRNAAGEYRWLLDRGVPRYAPSGEFLGYIGTCVDITERKQAEAEIRRLNTGLEQRVLERTAELTGANRELDSFAYAVTHDLRAPLRAMSGFSTALLEDYGDILPDQGHAYLEQIQRASLRMNELIDGLLTLSRNTRDELNQEAIDLTALCHRLLDDLARGDPQRQVGITLEPGLLVRGDPRMIAVALQNLLGNAWKFTADCGAPAIRVYAEEGDGGRRYCIADNGVGFDMAHGNRLFQPFQRLHRQDEFPGLGIGLATVQRIIHRHGGHIDARGEPGKGAVFCFSLGAEAQSS